MSDSKHLADKDDSIFPGNDQKKTADSGRPDISFGAAPAAPAPRPVQQPQKPVTNEPTAAPSQRPAASGGQQRPQRTEMPQSRPVQQTKPPQPNKTPSAAGTAAKTAAGAASQARNGQQAKKPEASGVQRPGNLSACASQSKRPLSTIAPPTAAPCPSMYFVVECVTMSHPNSIGRQLTGVAKVLSTMSGTPCACAAS